jgi:hypothetical protein
MSMRCSISLVNFVLLSAAWSANGHSAPAYRFEWVTPASQPSVPRDINDAGVIVGECRHGFLNHACEIDGTRIRDLHPPAIPFGESRALAVNASGHAVLQIENGGFEAWYWDGIEALLIHPDGSALDLNDGGLVVGQDAAGRAWSWDPAGGIVDLAPLIDEPWSGASTVNNAGHFAGMAAELSGFFPFSESMFYHDGASLHRISFGPPFLGAIASRPGRMNDVGQFVGGLGGGTFVAHAFVYDIRDDSTRDLHPMAGVLSEFPESHARDINTAGQIVGVLTSGGRTRVDRAVVIQDSHITDLQDYMPPDVESAEANAINASGVIVGAAMLPRASRRGFRMTPIDASVTVRITPRTLNVGAPGATLSARIELGGAEGLSMVPESIVLLKVDGRRVGVGGLAPINVQRLGNRTIHARFAGASVAAVLPDVRSSRRPEVVLRVLGHLDDGTVFIAEDVVRIVGPSGRATPVPLPRP